MRGDFVLQLRTDADLNGEAFQGRIEHMDSGRSARFHSVEELVAFILRTMQRDASAANDPISAPTSSPKDLTKS
jgi:hypothetical protein